MWWAREMVHTAMSGASLFPKHYSLDYLEPSSDGVDEETDRLNR